MAMNYYDWLASQYAYRYPDLYNRLVPLIEEEIDHFQGVEMSPYHLDRSIDNIYRRYSNLYSQTFQYWFGGNDTLRNIIYILLLSRLFRRDRYRSPRYPDYRDPFTPY